VEYALANKLVHKPAFKWWVPYTLKKREQILSKLETHYMRREEKYGIQLPKTATEALQFDRETNTTMWADAITKEMSVILPAMRILDENSKPPIGYQEIPCPMEFDVKVDFTRKARYIGGGHVTRPPTIQTCASVVTRELVRIASEHNGCGCSRSLLKCSMQGEGKNNDDFIVIITTTNKKKV
jgi:hypothetical protein